MKMLHDVRVLVLSDQPRDSEQLLVWLPSEGARVALRPWPEPGSALDGPRPDIIVVDLHGNESRAEALLAQLKSGSETYSAPLIALSRRSAPLAPATWSAGFNKHIAQPCHPADLVHAIASLTKSMPVVPEPAETHEQAFHAVFAACLARADLRGALALLNTSGPFRFTSVLRFDEGEQLTSLWTYDRDHPEHDAFPLDTATNASYCVRVRDSQAPFQMADSSLEASVATHPARASVRSYCGVPLFHEDGSFFGTLCSFDALPRSFGDKTLARLLAAAPIIQSHLGKAGWSTGSVSQ